MKRRAFIKTIPVLTLFPATQLASAEGLNTIRLPKPQKTGGKTVMEALQERKTNRRISSKDLPLQVLSNLLWAAFGVNRRKISFNKPGRTAPSASNSQEIDLYIARPEGVYRYEPVFHRLIPVVKGDFRKRSNRRGSAASAPVNIFYIADLARYDQGPSQPDRRIGDPEVQKSYYYTDTGFIAQNVYLFAAAHGLAAWFHNCDKQDTPKEFSLKSNQRVLFAQTVGYPA